jgi:hypothetical protein
MEARGKSATVSKPEYLSSLTPKLHPIASNETKPLMQILIDGEHVKNCEPAQQFSFYGFSAKIYIQGGSILLKSLKSYVLLSYISFMLEVLTTECAQMSEFEPKVPSEGA